MSRARRIRLAAPVAGLAALVIASAPGAAAAPLRRRPATPLAGASQHVVEIMLENHSFDSLFGHFAGARGIAAGTVLPAPTGTGTVAPILAGANEGEVQPGLNNSRAAELTMMDERAGRYQMDGYTRYPGEGLSAITGFPASMDPNLHYLAHRYELFDANFQPVIGPSLPNVLAAVTGSAHGVSTNVQPSGDLVTGSIFEQLAAHGRTSGFYVGVPPSVLAGSIWPRLLPAGERLQPLSALYRALARGSLPAFSFVRPGVGYSMEAPEDVGEGDAFVGQLLAAIGRSPAWSSTTVFVTYDEGGGFWDGVPPPPRTGEGTRTPTIVISPTARPGVFSAPTTNLSILSYLDRLFGLRALTPAQQKSNDLAGAFRVGAAPLLPPPRPPVVPRATIVATSSDTLVDPSPVAPGARLELTLTERNPALEVVPSSARVSLRVVGPSGALASGSVPSTIGLRRGSAVLSLRLGEPGYYRITMTAPGGVLGDATVEVGVGANTP